MELLNYITFVLRAVGGGIAGFGFVQLVLALKNQNPNAKAEASTELAVGFVIIVMAPKITDFITSYMTI